MTQAPLSAAYQVLFLGNLHHVFVAVFGQRVAELGVVQPHFGLVERSIEDVEVVLGILVTPLDGSQVHDEAAKYVLQDIVLFGVVLLRQGRKGADCQSWGDGGMGLR